MPKLFILLFACLIAACSTYGRPVTQEQLDLIKKGETTQADLMSSLGSPLVIARNSDGGQVMSWAYAKVGFAGSSYTNQSLTVTLDPSGKVSSYTTTDTGNPYR